MRFSMPAFKITVVDTPDISSALLGQEIRLLNEIPLDEFKIIPETKIIHFYQISNPIKIYQTARGNLDIIY